MSRTTFNSAMQLVIQRTPTGEPSQVVVRSTPLGARNSVDFGALVIFSMLSRYQVLNETRGLDWVSGAFGKTGMNRDVWMGILGWLLDGHAFQLFLPMMAPERFLSGFQGRLEELAIPIRKLEARVSIPSALFARNYQRRFEIACLLDAALNADHAAVERILAGKDTAAIKAMLSTSGTAVIEHLGIERSGTPLQMVLYSHDETLFKMLADQMDSEEVQLQCQKVFDDCGVDDYRSLIEKQIRDANRLCAELVAASEGASAVDDVLDRFNMNLDQYVWTHSVHNPYVLQCLFEIYDALPDWRSKCLVSQQAIGHAQKLSSARWLQHLVQGIYNLSPINDSELPLSSLPRWVQHIAQGVYNLGRTKDPEIPRSSFMCRDSSPAVDVRSHAVFSHLGVDTCIDIDGYTNADAVLTDARRLLTVFNFVLSKNSAFVKLTMPACEQRCVIQ